MCIKRIKFLKMNSYGNDFIIIKNKIVKLPYFYSRNLGIGFDQLLLFSIKKKGKIICRIYNSDMSEAFNCANGLRCLSFYIFKKIHINKIYIYTKSGKYKFFLIKKNIVMSCIKKYNCNFSKYIEFKYKKMFFRNIKNNIQINLNLSKKYFQFVNIGNLHIVFFIKNKKEIKDILKKNKKKYNCNISFLDYKKNKINTYENGSGFTLSCGSGTFASCISYTNCKNINKVVIKNNLGFLSFYKKSSGYYLVGSCLFSFNGSFFYKC